MKRDVITGRTIIEDDDGPPFGHSREWFIPVDGDEPDFSEPIPDVDYPVIGFED